VPLYTYKAVSPEGRMVFGRIDAINLVDLEMRLRRMELDLVSGEPVSNRSLLGSGSVPRREIIHFCFHLQQLVRAGVPILEGLTDLRDSLEHPRFREVVASLIESIEGGQTLSQAMESHGRVFSKVFVSLIRAGEATGRLPEVLHSLNESLKWEDELASQTKKMIAYPAFVGTIVLAATCFLMVYMVPQLKLFVKNMGQTLPLQTRILFFISDLMVAYWYVLLVLPLMVALGLRLLLTSNPLARFSL
jgi:type IV pilus assembly protein PilC